MAMRLRRAASEQQKRFKSKRVMYEHCGLVGSSPDTETQCNGLLRLRGGLVQSRHEDEDQLFFALLCERFFLSSITPIWEFARSRTF
jgi:hypothetical protein